MSELSTHTPALLNIKIIMLSERKIENFRKCNLIYSDKKQINDSLQICGGGDRVSRNDSK